MNLILMHELLQQISDEVSGWPKVTAGPRGFGGTEYRFDQAEIGHIHRDGTLDIPYPISVRNELIAEGMVERHHFLPESGWTTFLVNAANLERGLWLPRLSYLRTPSGKPERSTAGTVPGPKVFLRSCNERRGLIRSRRWNPFCDSHLPTFRCTPPTKPLLSGRLKPSVTWV